MSQRVISSSLSSERGSRDKSSRLPMAVTSGATTALLPVDSKPCGILRELSFLLSSGDGTLLLLSVDLGTFWESSFNDIVFRSSGNVEALVFIFGNEHVCVGAYGAYCAPSGLSEDFSNVIFSSI